MSAIDAIASELVTSVEEQTRVWQRLLDLSQAQLEALQAQNAPAVHAILQEIELTMLERSRAEVRRSVLATQAAALLGIAPESVTRDAIVARCDEQLGAQLEAAAEQLVALVVEVDNAVARNTILLQQELQIIDLLIQGATTDTSVRATYGKQGMQSEAPRLRLLDAQV